MIWKQLDSAIAFAATAHAGQVRKYDGLPYITHPIEVMRILHETAAMVSEAQMIAAVLHDVVEDTPVSLETIERRFGGEVAVLVMALTDVYTSEAYPTMNRAARKLAERTRLSTILPQAQDVKLADLISNTSSIAQHDPGFARTYLREKEAILAVMKDGDHALYRRAAMSLAAGQELLVQHALEKADGKAPTAPPAPASDRPADGYEPAPGLAGVASIAR